jgi:hypothetical protein
VLIIDNSIPINKEALIEKISGWLDEKAKLMN